MNTKYRGANSVSLSEIKNQKSEMRTYVLYHFKFWRYLSMSVGIVLLIIFGLLYLDGLNYFDMEGWNESYYIIMTLVSMAFGIVISAKVSTYTYEIGLTEKGLQMSIRSPFNFSKKETKTIPWDDILAYNLEEYGNGSVLNFSTLSANGKYSFTNSLFKKSKDMLPFYEALKAGADAFNEQHKEEHKQIGKLPGFYAGPFALWAAILLGILMVTIPIVMMFTNPKDENFSQYFRFFWFYVLSLFIIWRVYKERTGH